MVILPALGLVILGSLLLASLQLPLGTLLLLYRSLKKNDRVRSKTKSLVSSYISGATMMNFLLVAAGCYLISALVPGGLHNLYFAYFLFIATLLFSAFVIYFYYRKKRSTELWLPRSLARFLDSRAKSLASNPEAFSLGIMSVVSELPFSFLLFLYISAGILLLNPLVQVPSLIFFTFVSVLALLIFRLMIQSGKNLADVQRFRLKHLSFFRFFTGFGFFVLAVFLFAFFIL